MVSPVQFGKFILHKPSIRKNIEQPDALIPWVEKAASLHYRKAFDNLDKLGVDVVVSGTNIFEHPDEVDAGDISHPADRPNHLYISVFDKFTKVMQEGEEFKIPQGAHPREVMLALINQACTAGLTWAKVK